MGFSYETEGDWSAEKKVEGIAFGLYGIHSGATRLMTEEADLSAHTYASEGVNKSIKSNRLLADSRWDKLGPLQVDMEGDTVNLIGF